MSDVGVKAITEASQVNYSRDILRENLNNDVRLHMRSLIYASVESDWSILELRHVRMVPSVDLHTTNLYFDRLFMLNNRSHSSVNV